LIRKSCIEQTIDSLLETKSLAKGQLLLREKETVIDDIPYVPRITKEMHTALYGRVYFPLANGDTTKLLYIVGSSQVVTGFGFGLF